MGPGIRETIKRWIMPDAFVAKQFITQPMLPGEFADGAGTQTFILRINGRIEATSLSFGNSSSPTEANSDGDVFDIDRTFLARSICELSCITTPAANTKTNAYRNSLTGIWLRS